MKTRSYFIMSVEHVGRPISTCTILCRHPGLFVFRYVMIPHWRVRYTLQKAAVGAQDQGKVAFVSNMQTRDISRMRENVVLFSPSFAPAPHPTRSTCSPSSKQSSKTCRSADPLPIKQVKKKASPISKEQWIRYFPNSILLRCFECSRMVSENDGHLYLKTLRCIRVERKFVVERY